VIWSNACDSVVAKARRQQALVGGRVYRVSEQACFQGFSFAMVLLESRTTLVEMAEAMDQTFQRNFEETLVKN